MLINSICRAVSLALAAETGLHLTNHEAGQLHEILDERKHLRDAAVVAIMHMQQECGHKEDTAGCRFCERAVVWKNILEVEG